MFLFVLLSQLCFNKSPCKILSKITLNHSTHLCLWLSTCSICLNFTLPQQSWQFLIKLFPAKVAAWNPNPLLFLAVVLILYLLNRRDPKPESRNPYSMSLPTHMRKILNYNRQNSTSFNTNSILSWKIVHWTQAPSIKPSQSSWSNNWSKARTYLICRVVKGPPAADGQVISQPQPEHSQSTCWHIFTKLVVQRDENQNNSVRERIYWTPSMFSQRLSWRVVRDINSS